MQFLVSLSDVLYAPMNKLDLVEQSGLLLGLYFIIVALLMWLATGRSRI